MIEVKKLRDNNGNLIHAHGGGFIEVDGFLYWYGEDRRDDNYVSIYRTKDYKVWEYRNTILKVTSKEEQIKDYKLGLKNKFNRKVNIERPKIVYSEMLKKYVLWAHYENGENYDDAAICIASSDKIDGDYTYHGHFNPFGFMSRDCTIFSDKGKNYFVSASNDNKDLHFYLISEDCLSIEKIVNKQFIGELREAPALFRLGDKIFILTSYCTGWFPNQCKYAYTYDIEKDFSKLINIGNETTFKSQPMNIIIINNKVIYVGDRWGGDNRNTLDEFDYFKSSYVYTYIREKEGKLTFGDEYD